MHGPASTHDLPRLESWLLGAMTALAVGLFAALVLRIVASQGGFTVWGDFTVLWLVAGMSPQDAGSLAYDIEGFTALLAERFSPRLIAYAWPYPPHFWPMIRPLGALPFGLAYLIWQVGGVALLVMTVRFAARSSWLVAVVVGFCPAVLSNLYFSQSGAVAAALLIAGATLLHRRPVLAGLAFGLLTFKPTLGVLVPFALLAGRHWTAFFAASAAAAGLIGLSIALLGAEAWTTYLTVVPGTQVETQRETASWISDFVPTAFRALSVLGVEKAVALPLHLGFAALVAVCVVRVFAGPASAHLKAAALLSASVLVPPYLHVYDAAVVTMAAMLLLFEIQRDGGRPGERAAVLLAWLLPPLVVFVNVVHFPVAPLLMALPFLFIYLRTLRVRASAG